MSSFDDVKGVVLDCGSKSTKAGFIGEHFPRAVIPTVVGRYHYSGKSDDFPEICTGYDAISKEGVTGITWPVVDGFIKDWDEIEKLWFHIFYKELHVPPEQIKILHSVHPLISRNDREKMVEILFESFAVEGLNLVKSPNLILYASGRTTGVVYESGASSSHVTPVYEGFPLGHQPVSSHFTGKALSERLRTMLPNIGSSTIPLDILDEIKAKFCYVASNYQEEITEYAESGERREEYKLPDGRQIVLGEERFQCPEIMFQPWVGGLDCSSIVDNIVQSIDRCDPDYKAQLYDNVVVAGGSTLFPGLLSRLGIELRMEQRRRMDEELDVSVDELPLRQTAAWVGGSLLGSLDNLRGFWMTKEEYEDVGLDRIHHKFS